LYRHCGKQFGGAISITQKFLDIDAEFKDGLFNVYDELLQIQNEKIFFDL
jgi:hypothetical protein